MAGVKREREGAVGILTLDEAASLNAMTPELFGDLKLAIDEAVAAGARALVLTGAGRGFCSGQNLKAFESLGDDLVEGVTRAYWACFRTLRECAVPVVVAVNGVAAGGGFSLAMSGDVTVAARSASFIQVFSRIGLVPDLGSTWLLPRLVGRQRALEMMLFNQPIKADQAHEWGIVHTVFEDAELRAGAVALAAKLAEGPTRALVATRALLEESGRNDYATQFRRELEVQNVMRDTADAQEGRQAFVEKRPARFTGR